MPCSLPIAMARKTAMRSGMLRSRPRARWQRTPLILPHHDDPTSVVYGYPIVCTGGINRLDFAGGFDPPQPLHFLPQSVDAPGMNCGTGDPFDHTDRPLSTT